MTRATELRALAEKATKGPWGWWCSKRSIYLATQYGGREFVMTFCRQGMYSAQPCFQRNSVMVPALKIAEPDYNGEVDLHTHPDAAYIAGASPERLLSLLDAVRTLRQIVTRTDRRGGLGRTVHEELRAALADTREWAEEGA